MFREHGTFYALQQLLPALWGRTGLRGADDRQGRRAHHAGQDSKGLYFSDTELHSPVCPWHVGEYDIKTGECVSDQSSKLRKYEVIQKGDEVYVRACWPWRRRWRSPPASRAPRRLRSPNGRRSSPCLLGSSPARSPQAPMAMPRPRPSNSPPTSIARLRGADRPVERGGDPGLDGAARRAAAIRRRSKPTAASRRSPSAAVSPRPTSW